MVGQSSAGTSHYGSDETASPAGDVVPDRLRPLADLEPVVAGDFVVRGGEVLLIGARSASSGVEAFPGRPICPESGARDMEAAFFGPSGVLYSFATVHVSASRSVPYTIGYVDFPSGLRAFAHVRATPEALRCDLPVTLCAEGDEWWVEPAKNAASEQTA